MKTYIKHESISDSPYEMGIENDLFITQDKESFDQVVLEIVNGNPASFLISGYRGAGKTSFINKIKEKSEEKESDMMFISLNFGKYEEFAMILRKIIREVYLSIDKKELNSTGKKNLTKTFKGKLEKDNASLMKELELIYERTFYQVTENRKDSLQLEKSISNTITYNIKKTTISVGLLILAALSNEFNFVEKITSFNNTNLDRVILFGSALWAALESCKLTLKYTKKKTELEELSRSSLYDNEIAEFQLRKILKGLKKSGLKLVFIIDELDKIDDDEKLNSLISELKPLMLSGLASFILISGQKLYYKYQASHTIDDAVISSVFSKTIHVPLLSVKKFETLFKKTLVEENDFSNTLLQDYVNSKILQSNRLPRRFINLIRQNLSWEDKTSYININEENERGFKTDTQLLEVIKEIEGKNIKDEKIDGGIKDFLITQLHILTQKIKLNRYVSFTLHDIYDLEHYSKELHSSWYLTLLSKIASQLLDNLVEKGLIEKESKEIDEEIKVFYKWKDDAEVIVDEGIKQEDGRWLFMDNFVMIEKMVRNFYNEFILSKIIQVNKIASGFQAMIRDLDTYEILDLGEIKELTFRLSDLRNKISHGGEINERENSFMLDSQQSFNIVEKTIFEQMFYYLIQQHMSKRDIYVNKFDMDISSRFLGVGKLNNLYICFKVKLLKKDYSYQEYIKNTLDNFRTYMSVNSNSHLVILIYSHQDVYKEKFELEFNQIINKEFSELGEYISYYWYTDVNQLDEDLDQMLQNLSTNYSGGILNSQ